MLSLHPAKNNAESCQASCLIRGEPRECRDTTLPLATNRHSTQNIGKAAGRFRLSRFVCQRRCRRPVLREPQCPSPIDMTLCPSAAAALSSVVNVKLGSTSSSRRQRNPQCCKRLSNDLNLRRDPKDLACKPAGLERFGLPCRQVIG